MQGTKNIPNISDYVHLHNHTQYSLLDGLTKIPNLLEYVKGKGMSAVAITDHGTLSGTIEFYEEALKHEIKPIIGIEAYVASRKLSDKDPAKDKSNYHLTILAMNNEGYQNLMRLSTIANLEGMYYRPRVDHDLLKKYSKNLIILSGCIGGEVGDNIRQGQYQKAKVIAEWYKKVFGDRYYLEIQDHGHPEHPSRWEEQTIINEQIIELSRELRIPYVVTCDAHYLKPDDKKAHEILLCVQTGSFLTDKNRMSLSDFELHVTDPREIIKRWGVSHPEAILNSSKIAARCNVTIDLGQILLPKFPVPNGEKEKDYLEKLVFQGLAWRYGQIEEKKSKNLTISAAKKILSKEIIERAQYELSVIEQMEFNGYFLIIADFIGWGKKRGIVFGPGRGSAASSIIAYALKITELDPLSYDLLFERFLNPDRISMPDFDIDIQDNRRDEVIQYCVEKYGNDKVANIVTFGRMAARNAVRDVARVLQVPYSESDRLAKMIPPPIQGRHIPLKKSLQEDTDLKNEYSTNETSRQVFDLAVQLEGTIRSHGVHAAGVVIAPDDMVKFTPLEMAQKGVVTTQYSMGPIEELGLLKVDFLGLSNLTIIKNTLRIVKRVYGKDVSINKLSLDDAKTYELLASANTTGVFQFESSGMKRYLKDLKPSVFEDIVAMVALYRPGPMQFIEDFIARKHGLRVTKYLHPKMEAALNNTYGVLIYQEQVMQISKDLCGFTGGQADTLRKGIAKKIPTVLAKMKVDFIEGAVKHSNADRELMEQFWKQLEDFAAYCFNKSHAACYALIAYWNAYLKAHYPTAFMAALMTSDFDSADRLSIEITECARMGIEVLPPDINESFLEFGVVAGKDNKIRFALSAIKNVGTAAVEEILRARKIEKTFTSIEDFLSKTSSKIVNRKSLESLIKAGAFDRFNERSILLNNIDDIIAYANRVQKQTASGQTDLFGDMQDELTIKPKLVMIEPVKKSSLREQLQWERELIGLYISQHPLSEIENYLKDNTVQIDKLIAKPKANNITIGGIITNVRPIITRNGQKMAFVKIEDESGDIELIVFSGVYQQTLEIWERDRVVIVKGKISDKDRDGNKTDDLKVIVESAQEIDIEEVNNSTYVKKQKPLISKHQVTKKVSNNGNELNLQTKASKRIYIRLSNGEDQKTLLSLKSIIDDFKGKTDVVLVLGPNESKQIIKLPLKIENHQDALSRLSEVVGIDNVKIK